MGAIRNIVTGIAGRVSSEEQFQKIGQINAGVYSCVCTSSAINSQQEEKLITYNFEKTDAVIILKRVGVWFCAVITLYFQFTLDHLKLNEFQYSFNFAVYTCTISLYQHHIRERNMLRELNNFLQERQEDLGSTADAAREIVQPNLFWVELYAEEIFKAVEEKSLYRLPTSVKPEQYYLHLTPDFQTDTFEGSVSIVVSVEEVTNNILLHVQDLTIPKSNVAVFQYSESRQVLTNNTLGSASKFVHSSRDENIVDDIKELPDFQLIRLELREQLVSGQKYIIQITYSGPLRTDMVGFYKTYYTDDRGYPKFFSISSQTVRRESILAYISGSNSVNSLPLQIYFMFSRK
ncbi:Uncharacterized protein GBIM_01200 [Gryllus bimaculatus]|nr:Uncharacterized protein GBIM_01200 [Gryllus bimaculatus]